MALPRVSPLERLPEYTQALGMISVEIGILELMLGEMLGVLLGIPRDIGQIIYMTPQSYAGRLEILQNVVNTVLVPASPGFKKIEGFIKRTRARIQYRNDSMRGHRYFDQQERLILPALPLYGS